MTAAPSKSAQNRKTGKHQVEEQRACILDAAEKLFLQNGLEKTTMLEIAGQAGITKVTLYRYFANRDEIALAIHVRMLNKISSLIESEKQESELPNPEEQDYTLAGQRRRAQVMIRNFSRLRDAYRYIGMFDKIYLDDAPDAALTQWTKERLISLGVGKAGQKLAAGADPRSRKMPVIMSNVIWFLEKLALRGEVTWSDQAIPLEEHLQVFEEMIMGYFDRLSGEGEP